MAGLIYGWAPGRDVMNIQDNKEVARTFLEALSRGDWNAVEDAYADDVTIWTPGSMPFSGIHTRESVSEIREWLTGVFPDGLQFTVKAMTAEGERVAVEAESFGMHINGKTYHQQYHFLMVIRDGKIHELKEYMDTMHASEVLAEN